MAPRQREKDVPVEVEEAKRNLREAGASNVFETAEEDYDGRNQSSISIQESRSKATQVIFSYMDYYCLIIVATA